jgi:hypothetical protein
MRRRDFITLLGGAAAAPLAALAQQCGRMRRIGVLMSYAADDPAGQARLLAFAQELAQSGWIDERRLKKMEAMNLVEAKPQPQTIDSVDARLPPRVLDRRFRRV